MAGYLTFMFDLSEKFHFVVRTLHHYSTNTTDFSCSFYFQIL